MSSLPTWSTACLDWERRIVAGESLVPIPPLFPAEAERALSYLKALKLVDTAGQLTMGEAGRQWFFDFCGAIFGAYDAETGNRLINDFFLLVSKKNNKSGGAASIMLTALLLNWRMSGEYQILAPTIEVAGNSFKPAADMVHADEELDALLHVQNNIRTITHRDTGATLKIIAADEETVGGKKTIGTLVEEVWLFGKKPKAESMLREALGGMASRPEGFVIWISTHSDEPPAGIFKTKLSYFRDVRDGKISDPKSLGVLYEFPQAMIEAKAYEDPKNWGITNPNLGASVGLPFLLSQHEKDRIAGPQSLAGFYAKHLNVEIGQSLRSDRWEGADIWVKGSRKDITLELILSVSDAVIVGIDGGGLDDLLGLTVLGRHSVTREWLAWNRAWAHPIVLERRKEIATKLRDLEKAGDLVIVSSLPDDLTQVADIVARVDDTGLLAMVGLDQVGIGGIVDVLADRNISNVEGQPPRIVGVSQGWKLNGAIKTVARKLVDGTFKHAGQELMSWAVGNARIVLVGNAVTITKQAAGVAKIDPLMSLFNAATLMATNPGPRLSVFDQMGTDEPAQAGDEEAPDDDIDEAILRDPRHPRWQEMRERFEAKLARNRDQEEE